MWRPVWFSGVKVMPLQTLVFVHSRQVLQPPPEASVQRRFQHTRPVQYYIIFLFSSA